MKTERAIELLNRISDSQFDGEYGDERREALSMAIRSLEQNLVQESGDLVQDLVKDCINRQQAIDAIDNYIGNFDAIDVNFLDGLKTAKKLMTRLPSAQPERKKGKWIWWYEEEFTEHATEYTPHCKCSECGRECAPSVATSSNFCRNCGADMRGESE